MWNRVLWTIDNELSGSEFERLCIDLLYRQGFKEIVPVEPQDGGRDAEELPRQGRGRAGEAAFFQFSLEGDWRGKLRRDARKLADGDHEFSTLVFVTSQKARGVDRDALSKEVLRKYGWDLLVYSREWLRHQLEEAYPDLAKKYLGVEVPEWSAHLAAQIRFQNPSDENEAWAAFNAKSYRRAIAEFKAILDQQPEHAQARQALAWCQYCTHQYDEALASINRSLELEEDPQGLSIRACILAEKGITEGNKAALIEARLVFESLVESDKRPGWWTPYNLANVLTALGEHEEAIKWYRQALALCPRDARIWKNLATAYHLIGNHEEEIDCLDKALEIDPLKPEALASKGISLLVDFQNSDDAIPLLERAIRFNQEWTVHWPHIWYWAAEACLKSGQPRQALQWVEEGLSYQPGHAALRRLKSQLLSDLLPENPDLAQEAKRFWRNQLSEEPLDFCVRDRLVRQEERDGNETAAWDLLEECFRLLDIKSEFTLRASGFSIEETVTAFQFLPQYGRYRARFPVSDYWMQEDSLYDLPFPPPPSATAKEALLVYLSVAFGL